ncbi:hypothetical protein EJ05DRAFT_153671 [Pseudovirgaria hyperparasitica]|uniref:Uncharacterized protein n=1 Tax=Pseudovirgaria hyperparasitica TaxID=470096 RepID=A0A6A6VWS7_9PEZI|nr:uncharacterized protein EJ05DRAFT_153671 [Pseudovirgaria hyperparasitica]KAF2754246.1 hypothetical protein EJ05DRAFT_153671 [Pseudovirgaria hyperparasitica]
MSSACISYGMSSVPVCELCTGCASITRKPPWHGKVFLSTPRLTRRRRRSLVAGLAFTLFGDGSLFIDCSGTLCPVSQPASSTQSQGSVDDNCSLLLLGCVLAGTWYCTFFFSSCLQTPHPDAAYANGYRHQPPLSPPDGLRYGGHRQAAGCR